MSQVWILELLFRDRETEVSCNSSLKFECQQCKRSCATVASLLPRSISNVFRPVFCLQVNYTVLLIWIQISPTHLSTDVTVWTYVSSPLTVVCVQNLNKYKLNNQMNHFFLLCDGQQTFFSSLQLNRTLVWTLLRLLKLWHDSSVGPWLRLLIAVLKENEGLTKLYNEQ